MLELLQGSIIPSVVRVQSLNGLNGCSEAVALIVRCYDSNKLSHLYHYLCPGIVHAYFWNEGELT